ncbi:tripartite tricarboxylate transporter substrate binding protein [Achromobacter sp. MFA1 R4]|uniref:Bug family tripartite tricarboxylate transporter substrate binding protein n=1 Tax=Achromobacter sp. MFA1 R4 TaxID=1881016 RepID=UPI00095383F4|nr:tripartite tricarboxylate transporter substrate binding protein [Achromobacter sp. MFA1 R4]SIT31978.1 Tripartite-type tricarboxylate transporter, receptor component TctC [Achromobacter sp. MFA1 R4]
MKNWMAALTVAGAFALPMGAQAQDNYPARAITWIVPFAAGGPTDAMARNVANRVSQELKQTILIENVGGAGGTIGSAKAAKSPPDGYTFLVGHIGYMAAAPSLYARLPYDPTRDFQAVFRFPDTPLVLLVGESSPYKTVPDLIAYGKQHPGKLNFSNAGVGSTSHLVAAMFASQAGIDITPVAYKGAGPALNDLMGNQVDAMFDQTNTALPQTKGGKVRALGLTSSERMAQFPDVPTMAEKAIPNFQVSTWYGLYAPKGTPDNVVQTLYQAWQKALADDAFTGKMVEQGIQLLPPDQYAPAAFQQFTADEGQRWAKVIKQAGITLQ